MSIVNEEQSPTSKNIFQHPSIWLALIVGLGLGTSLSFAVNIFGYEWIINSIMEQVAGIVFAAAILVPITLIWMIGKNRFYEFVNKSSQDGLADLAGHAVKFSRFIIDPPTSPNERQQAFELAEGKVRMLANYIASFLTIRFGVTLIYGLFASLLGITGTFVLIKQNEIMEREIFLNNIDLPKKIAEQIVNNNINESVDEVIRQSSWGSEWSRRNIIVSHSEETFKLGMLAYDDAAENVVSNAKGTSMQPDILKAAESLMQFKDFHSAVHFGAYLIIQGLSDADKQLERRLKSVRMLGAETLQLDSRFIEDTFSIGNSVLAIEGPQNGEKIKSIEIYDSFIRLKGQYKMPSLGIRNSILYLEDSIDKYAMSATLENTLIVFLHEADKKHFFDKLENEENCKITSLPCYEIVNSKATSLESWSESTCSIYSAGNWQFANIDKAYTEVPNKNARMSEMEIGCDVVFKMIPNHYKN